MAKLSDNLRRLHIEEERIRSRSLAQIEVEPAMAFRVEALETAMNTLVHFSLRWSSEDRDVITIQELGVRLCSSAACSFKLVLSGYYLSAMAELRDLFETGQLLDFLGTDASLIACGARPIAGRCANNLNPGMCGPCSTSGMGSSMGNVQSAIAP